MIKTKKYIKFGLLLVIILLASCEGNTIREWRVSNESSTTIVVRAGLVYDSDSVYKSIETGQEEIITITTEDRGNSQPQQAYEVFSYFLVTNDDGETTDMQYTDNDSWEIYMEKSKNTPPHYEQTYTLIVTDGDFE